MTAQSIGGRFVSDRNWRVAAAGLFLAGVVVALAIVAGGSASRTLNGIGAVIWLISGVLLIRWLPVVSRPLPGWIVALAGGLLLAAVVRPGTLLEAAIAFLVAGGAVGLASGDRTGAWALLAPAIYLPAHLIIGIGRAMMRGGEMRTDPPPTAALVPLTMLVAAFAGGALIAAMMRRQRQTG